MAPPPQLRPATATDLVASLKILAGNPIKQPEPIYRPGYTQPKKPELSEIATRAKRLYGQNQLWRTMIYLTMMWVDQQLTGAFEEDKLARQLGFSEQFISSALADERNLIISKGAALKASFEKIALRDELRGWAQRVEDAAVWMRDEHVYHHAILGQRPLEIDEWAQFVDYGMYVARDTVDPDMTTCPIAGYLIDPAQVLPVYDRHGISQVYRVVKDTASNIARDYGDFSAATLKKIENHIGSVNDETEIEVIEYWDTWWRSVSIGEEPLIPVTAHKYGTTPYTVQYGGGGNPMFTRSPQSGAVRQADGRWVVVNAGIGADRVNKATPYLYYRLRTHDQFESIMARLLTAFKKDVHPPHIRYRSIEVADKDLPQLDLTPGASNEGYLGEEKLEPINSTNSNAGNQLLAALENDRRTGSAPLAMYGDVDKSNVTGVAQAGANDAGQHLLFPTTKSWEYALMQRYDKALMLLGNHGYLAKYGGESVKPIMVPSSRRNANGQSGYEFDQEVISKVGTRVTVKFTAVNPRDWPAFSAGIGNAIDKALVLPSEGRAYMTGDHDYDKFFAQWTEETFLMKAMQLPEFAKMYMSVMLDNKITESAGEPGLQATYAKMLAEWQKATAPPPAPPPQPGMGGGQPGMPQPMGQRPQAFPSPGSATPGGPGGISYPQLGAGPGSQGQPVGRPY